MWLLICKEMDMGVDFLLFNRVFLRRSWCS